MLYWIPQISAINKYKLHRTRLTPTSVMAAATLTAELALEAPKPIRGLGFRTHVDKYTKYSGRHRPLLTTVPLTHVVLTKALQREHLC